MTLLAPEALALVAAALAALLYLHRRIAPSRPAATLFLWERSGAPEPPRRSGGRLNRRFLLDAAIAAALGLALARPALVGPQAVRQHAFVLDASASMTAREPGGTRFELARGRALEALARLPPSDEVVLVEAKARPRVVVEPTTDKEALASALRALEPTGTEARLGEAVALALSRSRDPLDVFVFTDATTSARRPGELDLPFVHVVEVGTRADNVALRRLAVRRNRVSAIDQEIFVELRSFSERSHAVPLRLRDGSGVFFEQSVFLAAGSSATVSLQRAYASDDVLEASIDVDDALALDNRAYALVAHPEPARVLLVSASPSPFLEAALRVHPLVRLRTATREAYRAGATPASDVTVLESGLPRPERGSCFVLSRSRDRDDASRRGTEVDVVEPRHPVLALVDLGTLDVGGAALDPVDAPPGAQVLARVSGRPILAASVTETGRCLYASAGLLETELPRSGAFPVLVSNAVLWLAGRESDVAPLVAGEPASIPFALEAPELPGVYRVEHEGREARLAVALPVDAESNLAPGTPRAGESARFTPRRPGESARFTPRRPGESARFTLRERRPDDRRELHVFLLAAAALLLLGERLFGWRGGRTRLGGIAFGFVVLSLLGLRAPLGTRSEPLVLVVDRSESVSKPAAERALAEAAAVARTAGGIGVVGLGREAWVESAVDAPLDGALAAAEVDPRASNLEAGLRLAGSMLASERTARVLLASDGVETMGSARTMAAGLRARGVRVDVLPLEGTRGQGARVASIDAVEAPSRVRLGEPFDVTVVVAGEPGARASVALRARDGSSEPRAIVLEAESARVHFTRTLDAPGLAAFVADLVPEGGAAPPSGPGEAGAVVWAAGRPRVLYVSAEGGADARATALVEAGFDVEATSPPAVPGSAAALAPYDAVLLHDVPARELVERQMDAVADYVLATGGGFVMSGEAAAFGGGGYAGTPLEPLLPVSVRRGSGGSRGPTALVLVVDKSGSMAAEARGLVKMDAAKQAAAGVGELLDAEDVFGAIAFDREPSTLLPLRRVGDGSSLEASVDAVRARGPTVARSALERAYRWLEGVDAGRRQIVLVSDGELGEADFARVIELAGRDGIVLSTVGIGDDADRGKLEAIARAGGGEAVFIADTASLDVLARETVRIAKDWTVEGETPVQLGAPHPIARGMSSRPLGRVARRVAATVRPGAAAVLVTPSGDPILAASSAGLGRSAALTTSSWNAPEAFAPLWRQTVRWTARRTEGETLHPRLDVDGARARLTVDAYRENGAFLNGLDARAWCRSPARELTEVPLDQTGPGRYEGSFELDVPGTYLARVTLADAAGAWEESVALGVYAPTSPELRRTSEGARRLEDIARLGGGRVLSEVRDAAASRATLREGLSTWPALALLALLLFLADAALRAGMRLPGTGARLRAVRSGVVQ